MSEMPLSFCDFVNKIPQTKVNKILYTFNISLAWLFFSWPHFNYCTQSGRKKSPFPSCIFLHSSRTGLWACVSFSFWGRGEPSNPHGNLRELSLCSAQQLTQKVHAKPYRSSVRVWYCQWNPGQRNPLYVLIDYTCKGASDSQAGLCLQ